MNRADTVIAAVGHGRSSVFEPRAVSALGFGRGHGVFFTRKRGIPCEHSPIALEVGRKASRLRFAVRRVDAGFFIRRGSAVEEGFYLSAE